jgi:hypothetical protein
MLYGPSNTGKSTLIANILLTLRNNVAMVIAIAPSEDSNEAYTGIIPNQLIFNEINMELMRKIWFRQVSATKTFNRANNLETLSRLYFRYPNEKMTKIMQLIDLSKQKILADVDADTNIDIRQKNTKKELINEACDSRRTKIYKKHIFSNIEIFKKMVNLSSEEKFVIKYSRFNPNLLVIFDDAAAILKTFLKSELGRDYYYRGRHIHITLITGVQDDTAVGTDIRKNVHISGFTTPNSAESFFKRSSNSFDKPTISLATKAMQSTFTTKHRGLFYVRGESDLYFHDMFICEKFQVGSPAMWKYCEKIKRDKIECDIDNPFDEKFS